MIISSNPSDLEAEEKRLDSLLSDVALANDIQTLNRVDDIYDLLQEQAPKKTQDRLREKIDKAADLDGVKCVKALRRVYDDQSFIDMIDRVSAAQQEFGDPWLWSVLWANARQQQHDWAKLPEESRKTVLLVLQALYNKYEAEMEAPGGPSEELRKQIFGTFKTEPIARILKVFLPMEKANAFYKMNEGKGLHWYCRAFPKERQDKGVPENANDKGPLNKRYVRLYVYGNQYLASKNMVRMGGDETANLIEQFFVPEECPARSDNPQEAPQNSDH